MTYAPNAEGVIDDAVLMKKIGRHLIPFIGIGYLIAYIDRQNVAFAKLQMVGDLGLSESAYGLGASLFFIGYLIFEIPSNVILERVGARIWLARIMLSWGAVSIAMAYTQNAAMFYVLRFLLGACEAGFFPGVLYLATKWFPLKHRGRMMASFMIYPVIASAVVAPIGGMLLDLDGLLGLRGWQWVFLVTGAPAVIMAAVMYFFFHDSPAKAPFLTDTEKRWLQQSLVDEDARLNKVAHKNLFKTLLDSRVLLMAIFFMAYPLGAYGLSYWLPTILKEFGFSNSVNGLLNGIPWLLVAVAMLVIPRMAVKYKSETPFIVVPTLFAAVCLILSVYVPDHTASFVLLCLAAAGIQGALPIVWTLPSKFLTGPAAAAGLAAINSVGNLGGFIAQNVVPWIRDFTGSTTMPMLFLGGALIGAAGMVFAVQASIRRHADGQPRDIVPTRELTQQ